MKYIKETGKIHFPEIKKLHDSMRIANVQQDIFQVKYNKVVFSILFSTKANPYELLFGTVGSNNFSFVLRLYSGYMLENLSKDTYIQLCKILNLSYKNGGFSSNVFLQHIAKHTPTVYSGVRVQPHHIAAIRRDMEEPDKIYFLSWKHHINDGGHVQPPNLDKTKKLCGKEAAEFCEKNNISSCWGKDECKRCDYVEPWEK